MIHTSCSCTPYGYHVEKAILVASSTINLRVCEKLFRLISFLIFVICVLGLAWQCVRIAGVSMSLVKRTLSYCSGTVFALGTYELLRLSLLGFGHRK